MSVYAGGCLLRWQLRWVGAAQTVQVCNISDAMGKEKKVHPAHQELRGAGVNCLTLITTWACSCITAPSYHLLNYIFDIRLVGKINSTCPRELASYARRIKGPTALKVNHGHVQPEAPHSEAIAVGFVTKLQNTIRSTWDSTVERTKCLHCSSVARFLGTNKDNELVVVVCRYDLISRSFPTIPPLFSPHSPFISFFACLLSCYVCSVASC